MWKRFNQSGLVLHQIERQAETFLLNVFNCVGIIVDNMVIVFDLEFDNVVIGFV